MLDPLIIEFLQESNAIEDEFSDDALDEAVSAWNFLADKATLEEGDLLEAHRLLMRNVYPEIAGTYRNCDVRIGGQRKIFISKNLLSHEVQQVLAGMRVTLELPEPATDEKKAEFAKWCHVRFEDIHPFVDGNGRIGRILYNWHRLRLGLPIHVIHQGVEQSEYYQWFKK